MDRHDLAEQRSLALHRRIAERVAGGEEALVVRARERAERWIVSGEVHPEYARAWASLLAGPRERLLETLTDDSEHARALRQASPFAGAIPPRERWVIHRESRRHDR